MNRCPTCLREAVAITLPNGRPAYLCPTHGLVAAPGTPEATLDESRAPTGDNS